ncbi:tRNA pseudouridine(13) synthase TruD [Erwinia sp. MYb375]|uniref:tRNA pseudouridine(13) synthase TruD n=1 Tax=unclassified Erwinia TaxID=2622719 RepID=UPI0030951A3C
MTFKLKSMPEDFIVKEKHDLLEHSGDTDNASDNNVYFLLKKKNYETFEAITLIADYFDIHQNRIGYAGLKDCDGLTEQYISVDSTALAESQYKKNDVIFDIVSMDNRFVRLYPTGKRGERITVASLQGNEFNIVVRNVDYSVYRKIISHDRMSMAFVNYYDTQRFGIPGGDKITHLLGHAIEHEDYTRAVTLVNRIKDTQDIIDRPVTSINDFFARIDLRKIAFYRSSYSSFKWNGQLIEKLENHLNSSQKTTEENEGVKFIFPLEVNESIEALLSDLQYKYKRHIVIDNKIVPVDTDRPAIINTCITFGHAGFDELNDGKYAFSLSFFLPSGCYATMLIKQLISRLQCNQ